MAEQGWAEWPDQARARYWWEALLAVAERERVGRGVEEPTKLVVESGSLWADYGQCRIGVEGRVGDVQDELALYEEIDYWVAFERDDGPGRRLDKDRQVIAAHQARIDHEKVLWDHAAVLVFTDLAQTTILPADWRVAIHRERVVYPRGGPEGITMLPERWTPPVRELALSELWLETHRMGAHMLPDVTTVTEAAGAIADILQDPIIEQLHHLWPLCPGQRHRMWPADNELSWVCSQSGRVIAPLGSLSSVVSSERPASDTDGA